MNYLGESQNSMSRAERIKQYKRPMLLSPHPPFGSKLQILVVQPVRFNNICTGHCGHSRHVQSMPVFNILYNSMFVTLLPWKFISLKRWDGGEELGLPLLLNSLWSRSQFKYHLIIFVIFFYYILFYYHRAIFLHLLNPDYFSPHT